MGKFQKLYLVLTGDFPNVVKYVGSCSDTQRQRVVYEGLYWWGEGTEPLNDPFLLDEVNYT